MHNKDLLKLTLSWHSRLIANFLSSKPIEMFPKLSVICINLFKECLSFISIEMNYPESI